MENKKDFAVAVVTSSTGTTGTIITVQEGYGAVMPETPFFATLTPPGQLSTLANSEKVRVTSKTSADGFMVERAQGDTIPQDIQSGWVMANSIYVADLPNGGGTWGSITGTLSNQTDLQSALNAKATTAYVDSKSLGSNSSITKEVPTGLVNGTNTVFTTSRGYIAGTLEVFIRGIRQGISHVTETNPTAGTFTLDEAPATGDNIEVSFSYAVSTAGNADTVDGIHASTTATAGRLYPLNSSSKFPVDVIESRAAMGLLFNDQTTTSTAFADLTSVGPSVTVNIGPSGMALITVSCGMYNGGDKIVVYEMSGANVATAANEADSGARSADTAVGIFSNTVLKTGLNPGSTTFTLKYRTLTGTANFFNRRIIVQPL